MRLPLVAGNWKMHKDAAETVAFCEAFRGLIDGTAHCEVVICPPLIDIESGVVPRAERELKLARRTYTGRRRARIPAKSQAG
jgi:triosephosphate isomerase